MTNKDVTTTYDMWVEQCNGRLITPLHDTYERDRRVWNGMIDRRPAGLLRCTSADDVRAGLKLAREAALRVSVRGGGHNVAGNAICEGGLVIDLSAMKAIHVNPAAREVTAEAGVLWGEFDAATQAHGLATTGGQVSHTGIAGLTLGGGLGYLMGKHGAACDNLLSVQIVTADGTVLEASENQNADLFWAIRGAGANFGVVTSLRYRLHPLGQIYGGLLLHPRERAPELIAFHREFLKGTPDESYTTVAFLNSPEGVPLVSVVCVFAGDPTVGEQVLEPLRRFGPPAADLLGPTSYAEVQQLFDAAVPIGDRYYWKSNFANDLAPGLIDALTQGANAMPSPQSMIVLFELKGAIQRVPKTDMAFEHRDANFEMSIIAHWTSPADDAANVRWAREVWTSAQPFVTPAVYANHMTGDETEDRIVAAYGPEKLSRLRALKAEYDPGNVFCSNQNIAPAQSL
jgi:FAD/FMN-containing dehydrogenase